MSVEESAQVKPELAWFKSSYSSGAGGECVEVATCPGTVHVRDSKDMASPILSFALEEWAAFIEFAARD
ncbi:DUF397 domain-containing protein [Streptomyces sp. 7N604]|uniref:DUF397 domain-containing protein n=1 Tax=Streptomyces sp. 7N604 TaxID=3457415 RepID=UPI003FD435F6